MRRFASCVLLVFLIAATALAELRITGDVKAPEHKMLRLKAEGAAEGAALDWDVSDDAVLDMAQVGDSLLLTGPPGSYRVTLRAFSTKDGKSKIEKVRIMVVIEGPPTPPVPPVPPAPLDELTRSLTAAYTLDTDSDKSQKVSFLASVFKGGDVLVDASKTNKDLFTKLQTAVRAPGVGLPKNAILNTMKTTTDFLSGQIYGKESDPLDASKAKAAFSRLATALGGLK